MGIADVKYWRLWDVHEWRVFRDSPELLTRSVFEDPHTGLVYHNLRGRVDEALDAERVVYWGDFMHMAVYQRHMEDVLWRRIGACSPEAARKLVAESMMLRGIDSKVLGRVLTYGSTLSMNTPADYASGYGDDLRRLCQGVNGAWMRDPYSAQVVRTIGNRWGDACQGLDAAFLLHGDSPRTQVGGGGLGVFIGRSKVIPEVVATFGRHLSKSLRLDANWISWGDEPAFWPVGSRRRFRAAWPALEHPYERASAACLLRTSLAALRGVPKVQGDHPSAKELLYGLVRYDVILTDTYHLAINAWAQGVPAVCLVDYGGDGWSVNSGDPHSRRDKRLDMYSQIDALGLVVDLSRLPGHIEREVARVSEHLRDKQLLAVTAARISQARAQSLDMLTQSLAPRCRLAREVGPVDRRHVESQVAAS